MPAARKAPPEGRWPATIRGRYEVLARADARLLQNVLKQATSYDKKYREQAWVPLEEIKAILSGLLQARSPAKAAFERRAFAVGFVAAKVIQAGLQPSNEESQKVMH